jgi:flavorubredoxin
MQIVELKKNFYYVGVVDHALKVFDVAVRTDAGTSYNSYLLKTSEGVVVFEGNKAVFSDEYLDNIKKVTSPNAIKYLVVTHTEPDHSGAIEKLLALNPNIIVIASAGALMNLDKIIRHPFNKIQMDPAQTPQGWGIYFPVCKRVIASLAGCDVHLHSRAQSACELRCFWRSLRFRSCLAQQRTR